MSGRDVVSLRVTGTGNISGTRTNLLVRSEDLGNNWAFVNTSAGTLDSIISPGGTMTADKLLETAANSVHYFWNTANKAASSKTYTWSVYVKAGERSFGAIRIADDGGGTNSVFTHFNLETGKVETSGSTGAGFTRLGSGIETAPFGWFRVWITATSNAVATIAGILHAKIDSSTSLAYLGDVNSGLYVWGMQMEESPFMTTYIKTVASTATGPGTRSRLASWSAVGAPGGAVVNIREGSVTGAIKCSMDVPVGATTSLSSPGNTQDIVYENGIYFELASGSITGFTVFFEK